MPQAQLFITCLGDQFYTSTLQNMTHLLERLDVELTFPPEQTCCGQPLFNNGFEDKTRPVALNFLRAFSKSDAPIVGPSGSCVSMVKHHYPSLFREGTPEHALALDISARVYEFTEYLVDVLKVTDVGAVYHLLCGRPVVVVRSVLVSHSLRPYDLAPLSSSKFSVSTFTRGSPSMPSMRPSAWRSTSA